jgi:hypothetical protein
MPWSEPQMLQFRTSALEAGSEKSLRSCHMQKGQVLTHLMLSIKQDAIPTQGLAYVATYLSGQKTQAQNVYSV